MLLALMHCCLGLLPTPVRRTIAFPRNALVGDDGKAASKIGVRVDTPPFEAGGRSWQLSMYPCGIGESYAPMPHLQPVRTQKFSTTDNLHSALPDTAGSVVTCSASMAVASG